MLYQELIMENYKNASYLKRREDSEIEVSALNPLCGDDLTLQLDIKDNRISDISFYGQGCSICVASANILCSTVIGKEKDKAISIISDFVKAVEGTEKITFPKEADFLNQLQNIKSYPARIKCCLLSWKSLATVLS